MCSDSVFLAWSEFFSCAVFSESDLFSESITDLCYKKKNLFCASAIQSARFVS